MPTWVARVVIVIVRSPYAVVDGVLPPASRGQVNRRYAVVAETDAAGLRGVGQPVRRRVDLDPRDDTTGGRIDDRHAAVEAIGGPDCRPSGESVIMSGLSPTFHVATTFRSPSRSPRSCLPSGCRRRATWHRDDGASMSLGPWAGSRPPASSDGIDDRDPLSGHVGDVEDAAVRRELDVLTALALPTLRCTRGLGRGHRVLRDRPGHASTPGLRGDASGEGAHGALLAGGGRLEPTKDARFQWTDVDNYRRPASPGPPRNFRPLPFCLGIPHRGWEAARSPSRRSATPPTRRRSEGLPDSGRGALRARRHLPGARRTTPKYGASAIPLPVQSWQEISERPT